MVAAINLYDCQPGLLKSVAKLRQFIVKLCQEIKMKRHGPTLVERFAEGELEGYSVLQFIETSSITLHCDETENRLFVDIFSCKYFDWRLAERCCQQFFGAKKAKTTYFFRS